MVHDVTDHLPLVEDCGFLVVDDVSWESVKPAIEVASRQMIRIYQRIDAENDYFVFWKGASRLRAAYLNAAIKYVGRAR